MPSNSAMSCCRTGTLQRGLGLSEPIVYNYGHVLQLQLHVHNMLYVSNSHLHNAQYDVYMYGFY